MKRRDSGSLSPSLSFSLSLSLSTAGGLLECQAIKVLPSHLWEGVEAARLHCVHVVAVIAAGGTDDDNDDDPLPFPSPTWLS